jgi:hypothetical protein
VKAKVDDKNNVEQISASFPKNKIQVTNDIIEAACQGNRRHCMIAEAIRNQIKGATTISVDLMTIRYSMPERGLRYIFHTPRTAQIALMNFDAGKPLEPFEFRLRNGQAVSIVKRIRGGIREQVHNLGKRKVSAHKEENGGIVTETVGGKSPPKLMPPHPSHNSIRKFGLGGFTTKKGKHVLGWVEAD